MNRSKAETLANTNKKLLDENRDLREQNTVLRDCNARLVLRVWELREEIDELKSARSLSDVQDRRERLLALFAGGPDPVGQAKRAEKFIEGEGD